MGKYVADAAVKKMVEAGQAPKNSKVVIMGLTFKENCPDIRNSKVEDIIKRLHEYEIKPLVVDPWANKAEALAEYGIELTDMNDVHDADCVIMAVAHKEFKALGLEGVEKLFRDTDNANKVFLDVKGLYTVEDLEASGMKYWRL